MGKATDVKATIYSGRRYPCLCGGPEDDGGPTVNGENVTLWRDRAGLSVAHIKCDCGKQWTRIGE